MKVILTVISVSAFVLIHSATAHAKAAPGTCSERLAAIVDHHIATPAPIRAETYELARPALEHYRDHLTKGGVYVSSAAVLRDPRTQAIAGYRVAITDGEDDGNVTYEFDLKGKLVHGKRDSSSRKAYWFCQK